MSAGYQDVIEPFLAVTTSMHTTAKRIVKEGEETDTSPHLMRQAMIMIQIIVVSLRWMAVQYTDQVWRNILNTKEMNDDLQNLILLYIHLVYYYLNFTI